MEDTDTQVEIPAPDANVPETEVTESVADPSTAKADENKETVSKVQSRFDELTKHRREAERDRDYWRDQALRNQIPLPKAEPQPVEDAPLKTEADFDYDSVKYQRYILSEAKNGAVEAAKRELQAERDRYTISHREASFVNRSQEFAKTVEDFDAVVRNPTLRISDAMAEIIKESDDGPALAYHLGKNPEMADRIAQLPPTAAARVLGKIEAKLEYEREKAKDKQVSKAPPPTPKVDAVESSQRVTPDDPASDTAFDSEEWAKRRNKQIAKRK